jgi:hypothetical protein
VPAGVQSVAMTDRPTEDDADPRPRVTGWFLDPEEISVPLLVAIGRFVFTAAGLETALQLELLRLLWAQLGAATDDPSVAFAAATSGLGRLPAGASCSRGCGSTTFQPSSMTA